MLAVALFFQYYMELEPCPLCIVSRVIVIVLAAVFFFALLQGPTSWGRRIYGLLLTLVSLAGLGVSARHTWLQHLPPEKVPECGPGLEFWMNNLPATDVIQKVFHGSGECAEVSWTMFGLSIPELSLIVFGLFLIYSLKLLFKGR
ncbi:disulfide bond formation protein B [Cocleimonas flava]